MTEQEKPLNAEMVILARESRGFTQSEFAKRLGITQSNLSRIESGVRGVTRPGLVKLSEVSGYPVSFFMQKRPIYGPGLAEVFHRKRLTISIKTIHKINALIAIRSAEIVRLIEAVDMGEIDVPQFNLDDYDHSPSEIARLVRAKWRVPHGPIRNMASLLERAGAIIVPFDFGTTAIDAMSTCPPKSPPLFFVNKFAPSDRTRFNLAHELGHMVMHQKSPTPEVEAEAHEFAAEFLMPAKDIQYYLGDLSLDRLASLKPYWKVSMAALLKRSVDLNIITVRHGRTLWMQLNKAGYRMREPAALDLPAEEPQLLKQIVKAHLLDMGFSISELATKLRLTEAETLQTYVDQDMKMRSIIREAEDIIKGTTRKD